MAVMILAAGGEYLVYVHRVLTDEWFRIPYQVIKNHSTRSLTWKELENYRWTLATST